MVILNLSVLTRFWGINFCLPNVNCHPDEKYAVAIVSAPYKNFSPTNFNYPSLYKYFLLFFYFVYFVCGFLLGRYNSLDDFAIEFAVDPSFFYLINRILVAALGVLTVFTVYKVAKLIFDKKIAVVASFLLSLNYLHVRESHFGTVDVPMTFMVTLAFLYIIKVWYLRL